MSSYIILDLEMCRTPKGTKRGDLFLKNELIQIGAVLLDDNFEEVDTFMTYVSPQYSRITPVIQKLTGITQKDVNGAPKFKEALELFVDWIPADAEIITWSENDACQISCEAEYKNVSVEHMHLDNWIDCQKTFSDKMHTEKVYRLSEALSIADIYYDEDFHDALVDARNTALLFAKMQREDELVLNPYYDMVNSEETTYNTFANLLGNYRYATTLV